MPNLELVFSDSTQPSTMIITMPTALFLWAWSRCSPQSYFHEPGAGVVLTWPSESACHKGKLQGIEALVTSRFSRSQLSMPTALGCPLHHVTLFISLAATGPGQHCPGVYNRSWDMEWSEVAGHTASKLGVNGWPCSSVWSGCQKGI